MKLAELYALSCGLQIGEQFLLEKFFPVERQRYITVQGSSGMAAKNYPHYNEVVALLRPALDANDIAIYQIGGAGDQPIAGCIHLQGKTDIHQSNYILARGLAHLGNDSWPVHRAGELKKSIVALYGPTDSHDHSPFNYDPAKSTFIESHRFGRRPTFANQESPSTMAVIPPEQIANAVMSLVCPIGPLSRQSLFFGDAYHTPVLELVPNVIVGPHVQGPAPLVVRMDYVDLGADALSKAESILASNLQLRKCLIVTDRELNLNLLTQLRPNIAAMRVEVDAISAGWIKAVKRLGIQVAFFSSERDPEVLAKRRLDLYDACLFDVYVEPTREDFARTVETYCNRKVDIESMMPTLGFTTSKLLLSDDRIYLSEAHWRAGQSTPTGNQNSGKVIDNARFWAEQAHLYIHTS